jgi:hypothetical protein
VPVHDSGQDRDDECDVPVDLVVVLVVDLDGDGNVELVGER